MAGTDEHWGVGKECTRRTPKSAKGGIKFGVQPHVDCFRGNSVDFSKVISMFKVASLKVEQGDDDSKTA